MGFEVYEQSKLFLEPTQNRDHCLALQDEGQQNPLTSRQFLLVDLLGLLKGAWVVGKVLHPGARMPQSQQHLKSQPSKVGLMKADSLGLAVR